MVKPFRKYDFIVHLVSRRQSLLLWDKIEKDLLSNPIANKLAKARKMRKPLGTLDLKKFGPGKSWVEKFCPKILRKLKKN